MKLTRQDFEKRHIDGALRIAFIGMSNIGKSYTAKRLTDIFDFQLVEIDQFIWEELGHADMATFAEWLGQPYSQDYENREKQSIQLETKATNKALHQAAENQILDTTGSVIYTDDDTLRLLTETHYVVYIEASESALEALKVQYFANPKPLIWDGHFKQAKNQSETEAILSSYPDLLMARSKKYAALADKTLMSDFVLNPNMNIHDIFDKLKPAI